MLAFLKQHAPTIVVAMVTAAVTAAAPAIAASVTNADTVDGFDAVGCQAGPQARAGKLVATCANGFLPDTLIKKAPNADKLDGISASGFYRAGSTVADSALLAGFRPMDLTRMGYAASSASTTRAGKNGRVLSAALTNSAGGFLVIHASSDTFNPKARDLVACSISVDGVEVLSSRRWFVVNGVNSDDDCATDAVVPVGADDHTVELDAKSVDSPKTSFGRTVIWALFVPFGTGSSQPAP